MSARKTATNDPAVLNYRQIAKTWDVLTTEDWLSIPGAANFKLRENKANDLVGLCPNPQHPDTTPSFHIYPKERHGYCYGCGYRPINPIELIANLQRTSQQQALHYLCQKFPALPFNKGKALSQLNTQQVIQIAKTAIAHVCHQQLVLAIADLREKGEIDLPAEEPTPTPVWDTDGEPSNFTLEDFKDDVQFTETNRIPDPQSTDDRIGLENFDYAKPLVEWLLNARKIPAGVIPSLPIGVFPPLQVLLDLILRTYEPKAKIYTYLGGEDYAGIEVAAAAKRFLTEDGNAIGFSCTGSLVFPLHRTPTHISAIKTRHPTMPKHQSFHIFADSFDDDLGIFGLGFHPYVEQHARLEEAHNYAVIVEGEFDALQPMVNAVLTGSVLHPIYSAGGTGGSNSIEEVLRLNGIKNAYFMGDSPTKGSGGESVVELWASRISRISARVFNNDAWSKLAPAGDLDECFTSPSVGADITNEVLGDLAGNFTALWRWAADRAMPLIEKYGEDDKRGRMDAASEAGKYLQNITDAAFYAEYLSELYPQINQNILKRELSSKVDTEQGFIFRIANTLLDLFEPVALSGDGTSKNLIVYSKKNQTYSQIRLDSEQSLAQELSPHTGSLDGFIRQHVGYPQFLVPPEDTSSLIMQAQDKKLRFYIREAMLQLACGLQNMSNLKRIKNGYHYIKGRDNHAPLEFIINGMDMVRITRDAEGRPVYESCTSPRYDNILNGNNPTDESNWWKDDTHLTPEVLDRPRDEDLREIYRMMCDLYNVGFAFKNQEVTVKLLAALTMAYPIMNIFERQTLVALSADSNAGKTSLMHVLSGSNSSQPVPTRILMMSRKWDNYTVAGVINSAEGETLFYCLDEFEHDSKARAIIVDSLSESIRQLVNGVASKIMASVGGGTREVRYFLPLMFANISGAVKPQDINRLIQIQMQKQEFRLDPATSIMKKFSNSDLTRLRSAVNFGALHHVPKILDIYSRIKTQYNEINEKLMNKVDFRFMSGFFPVFCMMELVGVDWISFFKAYTNCNATTINRGSSTSESDSIMSSILFNPVIVLPSMDKNTRPYSLSEIIISREKRAELNYAAAGVFYDEDLKLILFNLDQVMARLLPPHVKYGSNLTTLTLRNILERHKSAITPQQVLDSGILRKAAGCIGAGLRSHDVVVLRAQPWLDEYSSALHEEPVEQTQAPETQPSEVQDAYDWE